MKGHHPIGFVRGSPPVQEEIQGWSITTLERHKNTPIIRKVGYQPPRPSDTPPVQEGNGNSNPRTIHNRSAHLLAFPMLLLLSLALRPSTAWAQEAAPARLVSAHLTADVPEGDADIRVRIAYEVVLAETTQAIPLRGVAFFGMMPRGPAAFADTGALPLSLEASNAPLLVGDIPLPLNLRRDGTFAFTLNYTLPRPSDAHAFDVSLPVLFVDWLPTEAPRDFFTAEITLPPSYSLAEAFPTVLNREEADGGRARYRFSLQVLPSLVRLRGYVGQAPLLTTARAIDLGVLAVLLLVAVVSWRRFRRGPSPSTHP